MKKVLFGVFAAFTLAACGGFNEQDCKDAEAAVNKAITDCVEGATEISFSCDTYAANAGAYGSCDFATYYEGWENYATCNDGTLEYGTVPTLDCN